MKTNTKIQIIKQNNGFTIIELITVMVVISILAAILLPGILNNIGKQHKKECITNQKAIILELKSKRIENPQITMEEALPEILEKTKIKCKGGGTYTAVDKDSVACSVKEHGSETAVEEDVKNYDTPITKPTTP
ncbi:MAG TPA: type II secretion system GspH family protein [Candidatus Dorea intestinavium]|nr:type II secretion system GspH family protein [Candidatus Dorea intestinavium]